MKPWRGREQALLQHIASDVSLPQGVSEASVPLAEKILAGSYDLLGYRDLQFGSPPNWHLEPVSGKVSPLIPWKKLDNLDSGLTGDKKIVWELNRHQYLVVLALAYRQTRDERFAATVVSHIQDWILRNPPGRGINWVSSLELAFRSISWIWSLRLIEGSTARTRASCVQIASAVFHHATHVTRFLSTWTSPNTHLTGEALGLYYVGTCFPMLPGAAGWRDTGRQILIQQAFKQIRPDGVYFEQTTWYQRYTAEFYQHFLLLARRNRDAIPAEIERLLERCCEYLMWVTKPDGTSPVIGDDDGGQLIPLQAAAPADWRCVLSTAAVMHGREDFKYVAAGFAATTSWLLGEQSRQAFAAMAARPPTVTSKAFTDGGYFVMRGGWSADSHYLLVDCGPHGTMNCGHAHADALAIEVVANGVTVLSDPGTYCYTASREDRDLFRSSGVHSTLTVDGASSSVPAGFFQWSHIATCRAETWLDHELFTCFRGSHDGYRALPGSTRHTRSILFPARDYWIVVDEASADGTHDYAVHFHAAPGVALLPGDSDQSVTAVSEIPLMDMSYVGSQGSWKIAAGRSSPCYGATQPSWRGDYVVAAARAVAVVCAMVPRQQGRPSRSVMPLTCKNGRAAYLDGSDHRDVFYWRVAETTDFEWVWIRRSSISGEILAAIFVRGSRFAGEGLELQAMEHTDFVVLRRSAGSWKVESAPGVTFRVVEDSACVQVVADGLKDVRN